MLKTLAELVFISSIVETCFSDSNVMPANLPSGSDLVSPRTQATPVPSSLPPLPMWVRECGWLHVRGSGSSLGGHISIRKPSTQVVFRLDSVASRC